MQEHSGAALIGYYLLRGATVTHILTDVMVITGLHALWSVECLLKLSNLCTHCDKPQVCFRVPASGEDLVCLLACLFAFVFPCVHVCTWRTINCLICRHTGSSQAVCKPINCPLVWATCLPHGCHMSLQGCTEKYPSGGENALANINTLLSAPMLQKQWIEDKIRRKT